MRMQFTNWSSHVPFVYFEVCRKAGFFLTYFSYDVRLVTGLSERRLRARKSGAGGLRGYN